MDIPKLDKANTLNRTIQDLNNCRDEVKKAMREKLDGNGISFRTSIELESSEKKELLDMVDDFFQKKIEPLQKEFNEL